MRKFAVLALILALLLALMLPLTHADVGNFAGDSDWGDDSDWDSGSDSDWGDDSDDYDDDGFDDFFGAFAGSAIGSNIGGGGYGGGGGGGGTIIFIIIIIVVIILIIRSRKKASTATPVHVDTRPTAADLSALMERDPDFNLENFLEKVRNLYVQLQNAWTDRDWEPMRPNLTDSFYNQLGRQLEEMRKAGRTNHVERISVLGATVTGYEQKDDLDCLKVRLTTRIVDYTTDDTTGEVVSGDKNREKFMTYEWTMVRKQTAKTKAEQGARACPNCGAPLDNNASSRCPYCGSIIKGTDYDWTLASIRGIIQRTQ